MRDLTGSLGMQPSSLYAHLPSKQHLLGELIRIGHEEHRDVLRLALLEAGNDPVEQLSALTRAHVRIHATYPLLTRLCNRELGSLLDEDKSVVLAIRLDAGGNVFRRLRALLGELHQPDIRRHEPPPVSPRKMAPLAS